MIIWTCYIPYENTEHFLLLLFALTSFFWIRYRPLGNTHSLLIRRPTRRTGSTLRVDHIANILLHCLSQTVSVKLLHWPPFFCGFLTRLLFLNHPFDFVFCLILPPHLLDINLKIKNVTPRHPGFGQVQQPGEYPSLHQSEPAQSPGQARRSSLWFLHHTEAEGREVLPGVPGVLLRDPPSVALRVSCLDEAQTGQSYWPDEREDLRPARQAAGGLLSHRSDVSVCSVHDGWAQTPRHRSCWDREDRETGQNMCLSLL